MSMFGLRIAKTFVNSGRCRWWSNAYNLRKKDWVLRFRRGRYVIRYLFVFCCSVKCWLSRNISTINVKFFCWR